MTMKRANQAPKPVPMPFAGSIVHTRTLASVQAQNIALIQRDAPYCLDCRGLCYFSGYDDNQCIRWVCRPCAVVFEGSTMGRIDTYEQADERIEQIIVRGSVRRPSLGPEEESVLENMRTGVNRPTLGDDEEAALNLMRGGDIDKEEARLAEEIDKEVLFAAFELVCVDCGQPRSVGSAERCRKCYEARAEKKLGPDFQVAQEPKENMSEAITTELCFCGRPNRHRGQHKERAVNRKKKSGYVVYAPPDQHKPARPLPKKSTSTMGQKQAMAQVRVMGGMCLHEDIEIRVSEMREWPAERITEFFEALGKVIEIPQQPFVRKKFEPAWPRDLEEYNDHRGLCLMYLMTMLHDRMAQHEKDAVWTLVQYVKRIEAASEERKST